MSGNLTHPCADLFPAPHRYIRDLATLVVAYGISINLVEVTWKSKIKAQFPNPNDYSAFMGDFSTATGAVTFTMMILSRYIFRYFGWGTAALITPTVLLITGIAFFSLVLFRWVPGTMHLLLVLVLLPCMLPDIFVYVLLLQLPNLTQPAVCPVSSWHIAYPVG